MDFIVRSPVTTAKTEGFCWICQDKIHQSSPLQIIEIGPNREDWRRAHPACVNESRDERSVYAGGNTVGWTTLGANEARNGNKYALLVNGVEVMRGPNKAKMEGMVELLEKYPEAARATCSSVTISHVV